MSVYFYYTSENASPRVTAAFLARAKTIQLPGQYRREHENSWEDGADNITTAADVDYAMSLMEHEPLRGIEGVAYAYFIDLGMVTNPTVIGCGHLSPTDAIIIDKLVTLQGTREFPVQIAHVLAQTRALCEVFPPLLIRVETWQGMGAAQTLQAAHLPVELYTPTVKTNAEEWPQLVARLTQRRLILPKNLQLREELLNLTYEVTAMGVRVVDKGKIHQDRAVVVRGIVAMLEPYTLDIGPTFEVTPLERAQMDGFSKWAGAPVSGEIVDEEAGYEHEDMRWSRVDPSGRRNYLW